MNIFWFMVQALASIPMLPRDIGFGLSYWKINRVIDSWESKGWTVHEVFDSVAKAHPQKIAIRLEDEAWTFKELYEYSLKVANFFHQAGYDKTETIALLMENHPRYVGTWLGLSRIGVTTALVNTGVKGDTLKQAVTTAIKEPCAAFIISIEYLPVVRALQNSEQDRLPADIKLYTMGGEAPSEPLENSEHLDDKLKDPAWLEPVDEAITKSINMNSRMVYIYTSGTEGYPKAAVWKFKRFMFLTVSIHEMLSIRSDDVLYTPMPLYHASGGLIGTGQMLLYGNTMVIKSKFSATSYFPDCKKYGVTVAQYIGEMCSYIYSKPSAPTDSDHKVRMIVGNGMRPNLWKDFQKRFKVKKIGEFYGSTEGNTNMVNVNNKRGAVGFMPWYAHFIYPVDLIEYDSDTGKVRRGKDGLCKRAMWKGLLVGGIKEKSATSGFEGYADEKATESKIIKDVFKKGDAYFNSGDVLERSIFGYYYFVDRLGDTYRWKGENVAASQVEGIITKNMGLKPTEVAIYGVEVPNQEGRAGMAAFAMDDVDLDKNKLVEIEKQHMIPQQVPVFLRITKTLPMTSTEKISKAVMKKEGWDPEKINADKQDHPEKLYYYNSKTKKYEELTPEIRKKIIDKEIPI